VADERKRGQRSIRIAKADELVIPVQINGKVRARLTVDAGLTDEALQALALGDQAVQAQIAGRTVRKVVVAKALSSVWWFMICFPVGAWLLALWVLLLSVVCFLLLPGCGYSLAGRGSFLPDYIKTIGVPTFANHTASSTWNADHPEGAGGVHWAWALQNRARHHRC